MSLPSRLELAIACYLRDNLCGVPGLDIRTAHAGGPRATFPLLTVTAHDQADLGVLSEFAATFTYTLTLALIFPPLPGQDGDGAVARNDDLDDLVAQIQALLYDLNTLKSSLNAPSSGTDTRPVRPFHLHHLQPANLADIADPPEGYHLERLHYLATVVAADQTFPSTVPANTYLRPGGLDRYRRPDTSSYYIRP